MSAVAVAGYDVDDLFVEAPAYSTAEAAQLSGIAAQTLHRLCAAGVITSMVPAAGTGSRRRWSSLEVDRLQRIGAVQRDARDAGVLLTWEAVARMWQALEEDRRWQLVLTV